MARSGMASNMGIGVGGDIIDADYTREGQGHTSKPWRDGLLV